MAVWMPPCASIASIALLQDPGHPCLHLFKSNECVQAATAEQNKTGKSLLCSLKFPPAFFLARSLFHPVVWATPAATACM